MSVQIAAVPAAGQEERKILHAGSPRLAGMAWLMIPIVANMTDVESIEDGDRTGHQYRCDGTVYASGFGESSCL